MKTILPLRYFIHTPALVVAIVTSTADTHGQGPGRAPVPAPPANVTPLPLTPEAEARIGALRALREADPGAAHRGFSDQVLVGAKSKIKANDLSGAEAILALGNPFPSGTHHWSRHAGGALVSLAVELSREYDRTRAALVVTRALQHLDQAAELARQAGDARSQVAARTSAAFLHERFRGDPATAIASYRAALQTDPADQAAQENLDRLERSLATLRARVQAKGR